MISTVVALALFMWMPPTESLQLPPPGPLPSRGECRFDGPGYFGVGLWGALHPPVLVKQVRPDTGSLPKGFRTGTVIFEARIDENGRVSSACVHRAVQKDVDSVALAALKLWKFRPARLRYSPYSAVPVMKLVAVKVEGKR